MTALSIFRKYPAAVEGGVCAFLALLIPVYYTNQEPGYVPNFYIALAAMLAFVVLARLAMMNLGWSEERGFVFPWLLSRYDMVKPGFYSLPTIGGGLKMVRPLWTGDVEVFDPEGKLLGIEREDGTFVKEGGEPSYMNQLTLWLTLRRKPTNMK